MCNCTSGNAWIPGSHLRCAPDGRMSHLKNRNELSDWRRPARPIPETTPKGALHGQTDLRQPAGQRSRPRHRLLSGRRRREERAILRRDRVLYGVFRNHSRHAADPRQVSSVTPKKIADARTSSEVLICISADSREAGDDMVGKAQAAGGGVDPCPKQDFGFMYGRSFEDPDGHIWEVMWMDVAAATAGPSALANA